MRELASFEQELSRCVRCGTCRSICPTFRVIGREPAAARGKLSLIRAYISGEIEPGAAYLKQIKECTMCGGCRTSCPAGVNTTAIINAARAEAVKREGLPFGTSFIMKNLLDYGGIMPKALRYASKLRGILFKESVTENGLVSRFSMPIVGGGRVVPELADTFFLDLKEIKSKRPGRKAGAPTVAFYAGCGVNFLMPEVGRASLRAIERAEFEAVVPEGQVCCGMPAFYMGDIDTARELAMKNLGVFEDADPDYIVTSCATCSHGLKNVFRELLDDGTPEMAERIERFSSKVRDVTEFLAGRLSADGGGEKISVTYHDPCHLNRNQGIREEPRSLLKERKNIDFREMPFPCSCCGLGGGLSLTNYELSIKITKRKAESVRKSGAGVVATACPGCIVQLRDGLARYGVKARVQHVVELL